MVLSMAVLPRMMTSAINIPNRDYWLAPARREATLRYIEAHAYWLGSLDRPASSPPSTCC